MTNKLSELSKPVAWTWHAYGLQHATTEEDERDELIADGVENSPLYSQEYVSALLAERDAFEASAMALRDEWRASKKSNAFLKEQLAQLANFNPDWDMLEACRESWREVAAALKEAEANLEAKSLECRGIEQERELFRIERTAHQQHAQELEKRVAELSELEIQVKVWESAATNHLARAEEAEKWLATPVRIPKPCAFNLCDLVDRDAVIASLREQGFTVEGDE
ncbi:hypothetical protein [Serratia marcescens]|uniref:hypothetical protein n=1 Tax=Serratia marcescens TaxID=615 RepID=UPI0021B6ED99|nr:hypothetical protein [Serratia marcescens]